MYLFLFQGDVFQKSFFLAHIADSHLKAQVVCLKNRVNLLINLHVQMHASMVPKHSNHSHYGDLAHKQLPSNGIKFENSYSPE